MILDALSLYWWMIPLGIAVGVLGTLIGAGGGFLLAPVLLLLYPDDSPETITSITLSVAMVNAMVGSVSYARQKRIDYRAGIVFAIASIPGAIAGALVTTSLPRRTFDLIFGVAMVALAVALFIRTRRGPVSPEGAPPAVRDRRWWIKGIAISAVVGFIAAILGVGGGIVHVPALAYLLQFPVHMATATSHFVLGITAGTAVLTHIASDAFQSGIRRALMLCLGAAIGAPIGARLSRRLKDTWIVRGLAIALLMVGLRLMLLSTGR